MALLIQADQSAKSAIQLLDYTLACFSPTNTFRNPPQCVWYILSNLNTGANFIYFDPAENSVSSKNHRNWNQTTKLIFPKYEIIKWNILKEIHKYIIPR